MTATSPFPALSSTCMEGQTTSMHTQYMSKPEKATKGGYLSQSTIVCTQHGGATRSDVDQHWSALLPPSASRASKTSVVEIKHSTSILNPNRPSLAIVKHNCDIVYPSPREIWKSWWRHFVPGSRKLLRHCSF